jgi:hypothetical protein
LSTGLLREVGDRRGPAERRFGDREPTADAAMRSRAFGPWAAALRSVSFTWRGASSTDSTSDGAAVERRPRPAGTRGAELAPALVLSGLRGGNTGLERGSHRCRLVCGGHNAMSRPSAMSISPSRRSSISQSAACQVLESRPSRGASSLGVRRVGVLDEGIGCAELRQRLRLHTGGWREIGPRTTT